MTQDDIRTEYELRRDAISLLKAEYEGAAGIHEAHLKRIRRLCKHPRGYGTSCMGDTGYHCPDCGYGY